MSKKLTPLENFEYLIRCFAIDTNEEVETIRKLYAGTIKVIETALKEHETHEKILKDYGLSLVNFREACLLLAMLKGEHLNIHNIANQLKALEIIKVEMPNLTLLASCKGYERYKQKSGDNLTRKEYELLRKVLL